MWSKTGVFIKSDSSLDQPDWDPPEISEWKKHSAKRVALNSLGFKHASMFSCYVAGQATAGKR